MNIFVTSECPVECAQVLPDKLVVKMPLESAQMLAVAFGQRHGNGFGTLPKKDGTPYSDKAHAHHPCTQWVRRSPTHLTWLIEHGLALCAEYTIRFGKVHGCLSAVTEAHAIAADRGLTLSGSTSKPDEWAVAVGPEARATLWDSGERLCKNHPFEAYQAHLRSKEWAMEDYTRLPSRRPRWMRCPY